MITESIWSNKNFIIPMAEISHVELLNDDKGITNRIYVFFKHSKVNSETQMVEPFIYLQNNDGESLKKDWCNYRSELEGVAYNPHNLEIAAESLKGFFDEIQGICKKYNPESK